MLEDDVEFYRRRVREELAAAETSSSAEAASAHRLLAIQYAAEVRELISNLPVNHRTEP